MQNQMEHELGTGIMFELQLTGKYNIRGRGCESPVSHNQSPQLNS